MRKVVKNALGGYRDAKDFDLPTHIILDISEYECNLKEIHTLNTEITNLKEQYINELNRLNEVHESEIEQINVENEEQIEKYENAIDSWHNINSNLIRVAKERANVQRKLTPKKQHSGYIFLNVEECSHRVNKTFLQCFKFQLQTPYNVSLDLQAIECLVDNDFENFKDKIGITAVYKYKDIEKMEYNKDILSFWNSLDNFVFKITYKANCVKGFWEVEYLTRYFVNIIPEMSVKYPAFKIENLKER